MKDEGFEKFIEQIQIQGFLCLPAVCAEKNYKLELFRKKGSLKMHFTDQQMHLIEMPYLDLYHVFIWCEKNFNPGLLHRIFCSYAAEYERAAIADQREQNLFAGILEEFPEQNIFSVLLPLSVPAGMKQYYQGRRRGNAVQMYAVLLDMENEKRGVWKGKPLPAVSGVKIALVTEKMMERWGIGKGELTSAADKNTALLFPYDLKKTEVLPEEGIFIVSNTRCFLGLGTLLYHDGPLKELCLDTERDFWVLPLSIHEAAVFPVGGMMTERGLEDIAKTVSPFGKQIWRYSRKLNQMAFTKEERTNQIELLKPGLFDAAERRIMNGTDR